MNPPNLGPAVSPNAPLTPSSAPEESASGSGMSAFAVLVGTSFLLLATFFLMSLVAVWKRSEADASPPTPVSVVVSGNAPELPAPVESPRTRKALVNVRRPDLKNGVLRTTPGFDTPRAAFVPHGTVVDMGRAKTEAGQTWYHVRAVVNGVAYEGWMHADILDPVP